MDFLGWVFIDMDEDVVTTSPKSNCLCNEENHKIFRSDIINWLINSWPHLCFYLIMIKIQQLCLTMSNIASKVFTFPWSPVRVCWLGSWYFQVFASGNNVELLPQFSDLILQKLSPLTNTWILFLRFWVIWHNNVWK